MTGIELLKLMSFIGAAICMGLGAIGPAIGTGIAGAEGVKAIGKREETRSVIMKIMLVAMAIAGSSGIYALVISVLLLYVVVGG